MYCRNCGAELTDNAKFCANCGNKIEIETKIENKKTTKLTRKQSSILAIILILTIALLLNEYRVYNSIMSTRALILATTQLKINEIDKQETEMTEKCTDDGVRGKYGYSAQNIYFKQKACFKNAEKIADEKRQYYYNKISEYEALSYWNWREIARIEKGKIDAKNKIIKSFNDNEYLIKSFFEDIKGLAEHNNNDWGTVSNVIAQRYNMGYNVPKAGAKLLYVVNNEILLKSGDFYMNSAGEVEYKPELSKVRSEFKF